MGFPNNKGNDKKFIFHKGSYKSQCAYMLMLIRGKYPKEWMTLKQEFGDVSDEDSYEFFERLVAIYKGHKPTKVKTTKPEKIESKKDVKKPAKKVAKKAEKKVEKKVTKKIAKKTTPNKATKKVAKKITKKVTKKVTKKATATKKTAKKPVKKATRKKAA